MPSANAFADRNPSQSPYMYQTMSSPYANAPLQYPPYGFSPAPQQPLSANYMSSGPQQPPAGSYGRSPAQPFAGAYGMSLAPQPPYTNYGRSPTTAVAPEPKRQRASPISNRQLETNEQKAMETLLKPWSDLRRAGIEVGLW